MNTAITTKKRKSTTKAEPLVQYVGKQRMTTSRVIAERWDRSHNNILAAIDKQLELIDDKRFSALNFQQRDYGDERGKTQREWLMTAAGFTAVAMGFTGKLSTNLRVQFVQAFQRATRQIETLERQAPEWQASRREAAEGQSLMAMALQATREAAGKETKAFHYANEAGLLSFAMTGQSKPVIDRQHLSTAELKVLKAAENLNARLMMLGETYGDRKAACRELAESRMALLPAPVRATLSLDAAMSDEARA